jgi:hypothetical protein
MAGSLFNVLAGRLRVLTAETAVYVVVRSHGLSRVDCSQEMGARMNRKREREDFDGSLLGSLHEAPSDSQKAKTAEDDDKKGQRWTPEQDEALRAAVEKYGQRNWKVRRTVPPHKRHPIVLNS